MNSEKFAAAVYILLSITESDVAVSWEFYGENSSPVVAEITTTEVTVRDGLILLRLDGISSEKITQSFDLFIDDDVYRYSLIVEVLDHKRTVIIREQGYLRRALDIGTGIETYRATNDVECL